MVSSNQLQPKIPSIHYVNTISPCVQVITTISSNLQTAVTRNQNCQPKSPILEQRDFWPDKAVVLPKVVLFGDDVFSYLFSPVSSKPLFPAWYKLQIPKTRIGNLNHHFWNNVTFGQKEPSFCQKSRYSGMMFSATFLIWFRLKLSTRDI